MCKSMSAKRCLLIIAIIGVVALSAKVSTWIYCSTYHLTTSASKSVTGFDLNKIVNAPIGKYNLEYENRLFYLDRNPKLDYPDKPEHLDRLVIRPTLSLSRKWEDGFGKVFYRGEFYDKTSDRGFLVAANMPPLHHTFNQQAGFSGDYHWGNLTGELNARHKTFYYEPLYDGESVIRQVNNLASNAEIGYSIIKPVTVFATASIRSASDKKTDVYDTKSAGLGLDLNLPISYTRQLHGTTQIDWLKGDVLSLDLNTQTWMKEQNTQRLMPITHALRYSDMVTPQIIGFVSYENRSFYDKDNQQFLFNSHFLRCSAKYSFTYDLSNASFIEAGAKYAPSGEVEYKSSNYFTNGEFKVIDKLYLGAGFNAMPQRLTRYEAIARYYLTSWNEVFVDYIYTNDPEFDKSGNNIAAGVRMMF